LAITAEETKPLKGTDTDRNPTTHDNEELAKAKSDYSDTSAATAHKPSSVSTRQAHQLEVNGFMQQDIAFVRLRRTKTIIFFTAQARGTPSPMRSINRILNSHGADSPLALSPTRSAWMFA